MPTPYHSSVVFISDSVR